jgi:hypothetical protein
VPPGTCPAALIEIGNGSRIARLAAFLLLPFARTRAERLLARCGAVHATAYAMAPDHRAPVWIYPIHTAAAAYAHTHLLPKGTGWRWLRAAIRRWTGCDAAVGALLVVGHRDAA